MDSVPPEPPEGRIDQVHVRVRLPNGKVTRCFNGTDQVNVSL